MHIIFFMVRGCVRNWTKKYGKPVKARIQPSKPGRAPHLGYAAGNNCYPAGWGASCY